MSKIKNAGLDRYGAEPFEQQQFGTAGVEGVNGASLYTAVNERSSAAAAAAARAELLDPWRWCRDVMDDVICIEACRRLSSLDSRLVSLMTKIFRMSMTSGTTPKTSSSVTHDHTDHSEALPPAVTYTRKHIHPFQLETTAITVFRRKETCVFLRTFGSHPSTQQHS